MKPVSFLLKPLQNLDVTFLFTYFLPSVSSKFYLDLN